MGQKLIVGSNLTLSVGELRIFVVTGGQVGSTKLGILYDHYRNSVSRLNSLVTSSNRAIAIFFAMQFGIFIFALNSELVFNLVNGVLSKVYNITLERNTALAQTSMWIVALFYVVRFVQLNGEIAKQRSYVDGLGKRIAGDVGYTLGIQDSDNAEIKVDRFLERVLEVFHTKVSLILPMFLDLFLVVREVRGTVWWSLFTVLDLASSVFIQIVLGSYFLSLNPDFLAGWHCRKIK